MKLAVHATDPTLDVHVSYLTDIDAHIRDAVEETIDLHVRSINYIRCACQRCNRHSMWL
jgi:hypothetical protein